MGWLINAWRAASRIQKTTIVIAGLVALVAIGSAVSSQPQAPSAATPTTGITALGPIQVTVGPSAGPTPSITIAPASPAPEPTAVAPAPTSKPTPKPTPAPSLTLAFTSLTSPVYPGSFATATVRTRAGAYCTIVVEYKSGPSMAAGLGPKVRERLGRRLVDLEGRDAHNRRQLAGHGELL